MDPEEKKEEGEIKPGEADPGGDSNPAAGAPAGGKEQPVPYNRFKEVVDKVKDLEEKLSKGQPQSPPASDKEQQERQAKDYLKGISREALKELKDEEAREAKAAEAQFRDDLDDELALNPDVKKAEFLKFYEDKKATYGFTSVRNAIAVFKDVGPVLASEAAKAARDRKPDMPGQGGSGKAPAGPPAEDSKRSYHQVLEDAKRALG